LKFHLYIIFLYICYTLYIRARNLEIQDKTFCTHTHVTGD